jgi:tetratricopeptide (TPR) repeat protein
VSEHYDHLTLQDYLDDPDNVPDRARLERHLETCAACRAVLTELRDFEVTLSTDAVWEGGGTPAPEPPEALRMLADLLTTEDSEAETMLSPMLASPASFRRANIPSILSMHTAGVVRRLCTESRELRERQPMHALVVTDAAIAIADQLPAARYPAALLDELRGEAWLQRGNVLRYLGRYPEALDALDIAARAFGRSPGGVFSNAIVDYSRGVIFMELDRQDEALRLARKSARVFRQFGEEERFLHAKMLEAGIAFHRQQLREAHALFASLVPVALNIGSPETLACVYANVANCEVKLGELRLAEEHYARALSLYEAIGLEAGRIRTRWNLGSLRVTAGHLEEGIALLRAARAEFEQIGARTDAALVTLDIAEALLATGARDAAREAGALCAGLAESFAAVGMTGNALTALAFLRDAFEIGTATPDLVRHVRKYIETRPDQEGKPYSPPSRI